MNNKIIKEVDKILKERRLIVLERTKNAKEELLFNEEYAHLIKKRRLNTLVLSRAFSANIDCTEYEILDKKLNNDIKNIEDKYLKCNDFYFCKICKEFDIKFLPICFDIFRQSDV